MGQVMDVFTDADSYLVDALNWSSVGSSTGVGCFSVKTGNPEHIQDLRGVVRSIMFQGKCFETFPKKAMMQSFSLSAFYPRSTAFVGIGKLIEWLFFCNKGLKGTIWPSLSKKFPDNHPNPSKQGARILTFTGDQKFLDSLHAFPRGFPFHIKIANVYIQGGERTRTRSSATQIHRRRPRMTEEGLKALLARHGKSLLDEAEEEADNQAHRASQNHAKKNLKKKTALKNLANYIPKDPKFLAKNLILLLLYLPALANNLLDPMYLTNSPNDSIYLIQNLPMNLVKLPEPMYLAILMNNLPPMNLSTTERRQHNYKQKHEGRQKYRHLSHKYRDLIIAFFFNYTKLEN